MTESHISELFRYVRIRGATQDSNSGLEVIEPPAVSTYRRLAPLPNDPHSRYGLPSARGSARAGTVTERMGESHASESQGVDFFIALGEALSSGEGQAVLNKARDAGVPDPEQIASLWDRLAETLLDPGRHGDAARITQGLRAAWLCDRMARTDESPKELAERARSAVVHLQPLPETPATAAPAAPASTAPDQPGVAERRASIAALEQFLREVHDAPARLVELPLPANEPQRGEREPPSWFRAQRPAPRRPATYTDIRHDLSGLSAESQALALRFGGEVAAPATLLDRAQEEIDRLSRDMAADAPAGSRIVVSGGTMSIAAGAQRPTGWAVADRWQDSLHQGHPVSWGASKCPVRISGVADFLRVEQRLVEYRAGYLAHVENVLQGEMKERLTRSLTRSELTIIEESERVEETEREEQRTSRFDMEKESEKALNSVAEMHGEVSASVSATSGYATVVVEGNFGFSSQTTKNEVEKSATKFSQTVTSRALDRIKTRTAQARTTKMLKEFEDNVRHVLDNRGGDDHVVGAYRWIDQVYSARVMNYGARIAIEITVPDPGAFLRPMRGGRDASLPEPPESTSHPFGPLKSHKDIDRTNYGYFAALYGADVKPPPRDILFVTKGLAQPPPIEAAAVHSAGELEIPEGYETVQFFGRGDLVRPFDMNGTPGMRLFVGSGEVWFGPYLPSVAPLPGHTGKIAYAIASWTRMYSMTVTIECRLSSEGVQAWQLQTYRQIRDAYDQLVRDAENQAAQEQARQGVVIQGRNPLMNEEIVRTELKKAAIWALCVGQPFWLHREGVVVCDENGTTLPVLDSDTCHKLKLAALLESAIDWKLMTYQLLPYYWGKACSWQDRLGYGDPDPFYAEFLRAGAARIVVPVANGEAAALELLYFLHTGQRWTGSAPPPLLADPDGLSAYLESMTLDDGPPTQVGDEWTVIVPTTLTVLECGSACVDGDEVAAPLQPVGKKAKLAAGQQAPHHHPE